MSVGKKTATKKDVVKTEEKKTLNFIGGGWEKEKGIILSINLEKLEGFIKENPERVNDYGDFQIFVGNMKEANKAKQTLYCTISDPYKKNEG